METLRIYPPVGTLPKWNPDSSQVITVDGREVLLPPKTMVNLNINALHLNPRYWGPEPLKYRPQNWDKRCGLEWQTVSSEVTSDKIAGHSLSGKLRTPLEGTYIPFGIGARSCLGKRFAQVEFVAALTRILRSYRLELALWDGETWADARVRAFDVLEGSLSNPTLMPQKAVPLRLIEREGI